MSSVRILSGSRRWRRIEIDRPLLNMRMFLSFILLMHVVSGLPEASAGPVLMHRVILRPESRLRKVTAASVVEEVVAEVRVPILSDKSNQP